MIDTPTDAELASQALLGALLVCASLVLAPLSMALARWIFPGRNVFFARWRFAHVGVVVLAYLVLATLLGLTFYSDGEPGVVLQLCLSVALHAGVAVLVWRFAVQLAPEGWRALGFSRGRHVRALVAGAVVYVLAFPGYFGLGMLWAWLLEHVGVGHQPQAVVADIADLSGGALLAALALAAVVAPFFEELIFRAFLQPLLVQNLGDRGGILVTSALFGLLHGTSAFLPIFGLSLVLCSVMQRTQSLIAVWLIHALHNSLMLAFVLALPQARELLGQ